MLETRMRDKKTKIDDIGTKISFLNKIKIIFLKSYFGI